MDTNSEPNVSHSDPIAGTRRPLRLDWLGPNATNSDTRTEKRKPKWHYWLIAGVVFLAIVLIAAYPGI